MKQAKAPVPRHLLLECPVPPMIGHVPSVHSRSADMQCKCSGAQQGVNVSQGAAGTAAGSGESEEEEEWQGSWRR
jgi:hypothetical protein